MIFAHHITAAAGRGTTWQYDAARRVVILAFEHGTADVAVCSPRAPREGAFEVERVVPGTWRVWPVRYEGARLSLVATVVHARIGIDAVTLLETPDDVARELAQLEESHGA